MAKGKSSKGNPSGPRKDTKQGKNGKKEGLSGSSFFTWFMVIAVLGVWTSVAVVWFDLVDYEEVLGKLGVYDADGDGDFDIEDAKVLLGLKERSVPVQNEEIDGPEVQSSDDQDVQEDAFEASFREALSETDEVVEDEEGEESEDVPQQNIDEPKLGTFNLEDALEIEEIEEPNVDYFNLEDALEIEEPEVVAAEDPKLAALKEEEPETEDETEPTAPEEAEEEPEAAEEAEEEPEAAEEEPEAAEEAEEEPEAAEEAEEEPEAAEEAEEEPEAAEENEREAETVVSEKTEDAPANPNDLEQEPPAEETADEELELEDVEEPDTNEPLAVEESEDEHYHEAGLPVHKEMDEMFEETLNAEDPRAQETAYEDDDYEPEEEQPAEFFNFPDAENLAETEQTEEHVTETLGTTEEETVLAAEILDDIEDVLYDTAHVTEEDNTYGEHPIETDVYEAGEHLQEAEEQMEAKETESQVAVEDARPSEQTENTLASEEQKEESPGDGESKSLEKKEKAKKKKPKLLNKFDKTIKDELDSAEKLRKKGKVDEAVKAFESLVNKYPESPRARYGKAQAEDDLAEKMKSNEILLKAINTYEEVADLPNVPSDLVKLTLKRRANRQQFLGRMRSAVVTLQKLVQMHPDDISVRNELGVSYLLLGDNNKAKQVYEEILQMAPNDGFAKVHYGFILKAENQIAESIPYLKEGLESGEPGTDDGRFYFHLGDALQRVGDKEAYKWYEIGHKKGHFASVWQRSLYNVNGLKAQPWWTARETGYTDLVKGLEANWKMIRDEGLAVMDKTKGLFVPEDENLREKGDWSQYTLWQQGRRNENSCKAAPRTCALLERFPESTGCRRGQIKYSVMHPGTHVWPHTGPTNCRLRMHLGLVIPRSGCKIRCANDTRTWEEGKVLIFDDSFEHEVWQDADSYRLIFIVDAWHPELTAHQRRTLPAI